MKNFKIILVLILSTIILIFLHNELLIKSKGGMDVTLIKYIISVISVIKESIIVATLIYLASYFFDYKNTFGKILTITLKGQFIFLVAIIVEIVYFYYIKPNSTLLEINNFYPLSIYNFFQGQKMDSWLVYPLQVVNFFEFLYILYLSYNLSKMNCTNIFTGLKIVSLSYLSALFLWVVFIMFLIISKT